MLNLDHSQKIDGVYFLSEKASIGVDENLYVQVRKKEGRIYPDMVVKTLPLFYKNHPLKSEWIIRQKSCDKILKYISRKKYKIILEIGCGNGWLSNNILEKCGCFVAGVDVNREELKQAARIFGRNDNVRFIYGNIFEDIFPHEIFDMIIFAASIQYFSNIDKTLSSVFRFLKASGEIHIIDSKFYHENEVDGARERSRRYYSELGIQEMTKYYFHHSWNELDKFNYLIMNSKFYKMSKVLNLNKKLRQTNFPWIAIRS